ncbi:polysaccharide deacetylase [Nitrobacter winogradskyi Nb-255]|uniref:Chitooligosaccharide deacetylase n=1 Tax=Nitrobacter winogradskyi (strain ATCC 25391 / DSM 10237 / CIP 104748 / NCIMB 11846 / Nb-255) TaxID=323098 RepID=Q3SRX0_NITWN|nr:polysaccharide deacetylase family protein [Nitrobacter winogradskyi]ABA04971.1 polysaccharide deacetylase [Nitrobacter winogradskyi Nb-255]
MARISKAARRRIQRILGLGLLAATLEFTALPALAGDCPGNPDALGTSRTLVVDPREHPRIGTMQYQETLPLRDHEVVLTFDDGPLPPHSLRVLDILARECVKATFFTVGRMARDYPQHLRRVLAAGHSIGTHSQNHPLGMNRMPIERARQEIDDGIASATAALGDEAALAPFMRIPGLRRAQGIEDYLASRNIQLWSADFPADDWRPISAERVYQLAISRIEAKGKGILLLHDIQARTVTALPRILRTLKERGYRIVHVVPARANRPKTATEPHDWRMHPAPAIVATASPSPAVQATGPVDAGSLPAPAIPDSQLNQGQLVLLPEVLDRSQRFARGFLPLLLRDWAFWRRPSPLAAYDRLSVPRQNFFTIQEKPPGPLAAAPLPQQARPPVGSGHPIEGNEQSMPLDASAAKRTIPGSAPALRSTFR